MNHIALFAAGAVVLFLVSLFVWATCKAGLAQSQDLTKARGHMAQLEAQLEAQLARTAAIAATWKKVAGEFDRTRTEQRKANERELLRHIAREDELMRQVQTMAERIATMRVQDRMVDSPTAPVFVPGSPREEPYSEEIAAFLSGIESEEGRTLVVEQIEEMRAAACDDEEILSAIRKGREV